MGSRKPIQIQNALKKDFADKIHKELFDSQSYYVREGYRSLYQFHFSAFYNNDIDMNNANVNATNYNVTLAFTIDCISSVPIQCHNLACLLILPVINGTPSIVSP